MENAKPNDIEAVAVPETDPEIKTETVEQAPPAPVAVTKPNGTPATTQVTTVADRDNAAVPCEAMASMILGIIAIVLALLFAWIPVVGGFLAITGVIMGIVAIVVGSCGLCKINKTSNSSETSESSGKCHAITGIVTGSIATFCGLICCIVIYVVVLGSVAALASADDNDDWLNSSN